jgi:hypothetical protein
MSTEAITFVPSSLPVPPSYEQCGASALSPHMNGPRADYVASPLALAALFAWDEDDDER